MAAARRDARDPISNLNEYFAPADYSSDSEAESCYAQTQQLPSTLWAEENMDEIGQLYRDLLDRLQRTGSRLLCHMTREDFYDVCECFSDVEGKRRKRIIPVIPSPLP